MSPKTASQKQTSPQIRALGRLLTIGVGAIVGGLLWQYAPFLLSLLSPSTQLLPHSERIFPLKRPLSSSPSTLPSPKTSPLSLYAQPFNLPTDGQKQVAYIMLGIGEDPNLTQRALEDLPKEVAIAISPYTQDASYWAQQFHQKGHEILVVVGLEPEGYPLNDPGANTLLTGLSAQDMTERLTESLSKVPYALGITHETGNLFTTQERPLRTLLQVLAQKGLCFLDTVASPKTLSPQIAREEKVPLLTVDRPLSLSPHVQETAKEIQEQTLQNDRLVVTLPLSESAFKIIFQTPCEEKPSPIGKQKTIPGITLVPVSFALKNPIPTERG